MERAKGSRWIALAVLVAICALLSGAALVFLVPRQYAARADALAFMKTNLRHNEYIRLSNSLTPTLDFGKQPQTPVEQIIDLAKLIATRESRGKSGESGEG